MLGPAGPSACSASPKCMEAGAALGKPAAVWRSSVTIAPLRGVVGDPSPGGTTVTHFARIASSSALSSACMRLIVLSTDSCCMDAGDDHDGIDADADIGVDTLN